MSSYPFFTILYNDYYVRWWNKRDPKRRESVKKVFNKKEFKKYLRFQNSKISWTVGMMVETKIKCRYHGAIEFGPSISQLPPFGTFFIVFLIFTIFTIFTKFLFFPFQNEIIYLNALFKSWTRTHHVRITTLTI